MLGKREKTTESGIWWLARLLADRRESLAVVALVVGLGLGPLVFGTFTLRIVSQAFLFAIVAVTVDLLWGYAGVLTFGQSAFFGFGVYGMGLVLAHWGGGAAGIAGGAAVGVVVGALVAGVTGWLAFWDGAPPAYAGVVTLALPIVLTQLVLSGGEFTGSSSGLPIPVPALAFEHWYWISAAVLGVVLGAAYVFVTSDAGSVLRAMRENDVRCRYLGLDPDRWKRWLMVVCGVIAGIAGELYALFTGVAAPQYSDFLFGTELLVWTALGGRGTLAGPVMSTIGVNYVAAVLGGNFPFVWLLIVGVVFVTIVVWMPGGLLPGVFGLARGTREVVGRGEVRVVAAKVGEGTEESGVGERGNGKKESGGGGAPLLEVRELWKGFGSLGVLRGVTLEARGGEVIGIVGPNGAGKTTLLRCIADGRGWTRGTVRVGGVDIKGLRPEECVGVGIGLKFQTPKVFEGLTVAECLRVARAYRVRPSSVRRCEVLELPEPAMDVLSRSGLVSMLNEPVAWLSHGLKQALELAMVLALEPRVLLLDEPTAGLTDDERAAMGEVILGLAGDRGLCVLLIEHDVGFVRRICSRLIVLHMGRIVLDGGPEEVAESDVVREIYIGTRSVS